MQASVQLDTSQLTQRLDEISARGLVNALRRTVDKAARQARKETIPVVARDVNVPRGRLSASLPLVKASSQTSLSASWTIKKSRVGIGSTIGAVWPVHGSNGLSASTFALSGGGSAHLDVPKAFTLTLGGNRVVFHRVGRGRTAIRAIYAASTSTTMAQADAAPRKLWERRAAELVAQNLAAEVQRAFDGEAGATTAGSD